MLKTRVPLLLEINATWVKRSLEDEVSMVAVKSALPSSVLSWAGVESLGLHTAENLHVLNNAGHIFKRQLGFDWSIITFGMPQHYCVRVDCPHILSISLKCNYYAVFFN